jgi:ATP-dependent DNA helicase DinG
MEEYREALAKEIYDLTYAIQGNALVLFTARDEMKDVYQQLKRKSSYPLLLQTKDKGTGELLQEYRDTDNAILFGLKSFWEGVDIPGTKLSLVIITKLPFPGRNDPIIAARRARAGDRWFPHVDLPDMIMDLRQGVGRLIRTKQDRGVIAILDQRLLTKRYKNQVLRSLGITRISKNREGILKSLRGLAAHNAAP